MAFFRRRPPQERAPAADVLPDELAVVRAYHRRTKHHLQRFAAGPHDLDWENQPDPFRRYVGAELLPLPLAPEDGGARYEDARLEGVVAPASLAAASVGALFQDSLALSAWKQAGGARWALRVNPSSGNLHPIEAYAIAPPLPGLTGAPSLLHYAAREHGLERLLEIPAELHAALLGTLDPATLLVGLTAIDWREAWKYGERAYRYGNHDAGHALAALALAAGGQGWRARTLPAPRAALAALLGVHRQSGPEAEEPLCLVALGPEAQRAESWRLAPGVAERWAELALRGTPSALSPEHVEWPAIDAVRAAARAGAEQGEPWSAPVRSGAGPAAGGPGLRALARGRRSAVSMDGRTPLARSDFFRALARTLPRDGEAPLAALAGPPRVHLMIFVNRVTDLTPGLYALVRNEERGEALRAALRPELLWERAAGAPPELPLSLLLPRDLRGVAAQIACQQSIAGDGAFSLGMLADFEQALERGGPAAYPRLYWECGAVGQVLYLEAEALGVAATGIGCFFDDELHALLGLRDAAWQSLYHFTVGRAVLDPRLSTLPAYPAPVSVPLDSAP